MLYDKLIKFFDNNLTDRFLGYSKISNLDNSIILTIDNNGNLLLDPEIRHNENKDTKDKFNVSYTNESKVRTGSSQKPNPFFNYAKHIFGLNDKYAVKWGDETGNCNGINKLFMEIIHKFNDRYHLIETESIEKFFENKDNVEVLRKYVLDNKLKDSYVLFRLITDSDISDQELWNNMTIQRKWNEYMIETDNETARCTITGDILNTCLNTSKITILGSGTFTKNDEDRYVNGLKTNKPRFCETTQFKTSNAIDYLLMSKNNNFKIGDTSTVVFSLDNGIDEDVEYICSCTSSSSTEEMVKSIKTHEYNSDAIRKNDGIYMISFTKSGKTLTITDETVISKGELHDNVDFWKNNFYYETVNNGNTEKRRFSIHGALKDIEEYYKGKNSGLPYKLKRMMMDCMINRKRIPDCISNELEKTMKHVWISNLSSKNKTKAMDNINTISRKMESVKNYNNALEGTNMNNKDRNIILGKIFESMYEMESNCRRKSSMNTTVNSVFDNMDSFMKNPNGMIMKFYSTKGFILDYARKNGFIQLKKMDEYLSEMTANGYSMSEPVTDVGNFSYGRMKTKNDIEKFFNDINNNDKKQQETLDNQLDI